VVSAGGDEIAEEFESHTPEVVRAEWLGEEGVGTATIGSLAGLFLSMCGEDENLDRLGALIGGRPTSRMTRSGRSSMAASSPVGPSSRVSTSTPAGLRQTVISL
jgi:hypothetical protein